jgi:hypothetical protein
MITAFGPVESAVQAMKEERSLPDQLPSRRGAADGSQFWASVTCWNRGAGRSVGARTVKVSSLETGAAEHAGPDRPDP